MSGLSSYSRKDERKFIHLMDGGITDNLGLLAFQETIDVAGGARAFLDHVGGEAAPRLAVISVNASTNSGAAIDASSFSPLQTIPTTLSLGTACRSTVRLLRGGNCCARTRSLCVFAATS